MPRKQKTIHYLYKTTCLITGRYYIGMHSTCNIDDGYMGSGKRLRYSIRKHGVDNHVKEILEFFETRELLSEAEKNAITPQMIADKNCMNLIFGGDGGGGGCAFFDDKKLSEFVKLGVQARLLKLKTDKKYKKEQKITASKNIKKAWKSGRFKNSKRFTGKQHSDDTKSLMSNKRKGTGIGKSNSQYGTCWITKEGENKKIKKVELKKWINKGWIKGRK